MIAGLTPPCFRKNTYLSDLPLQFSEDFHYRAQHIRMVFKMRIQRLTRV